MATNKKITRINSLKKSLSNRWNQFIKTSGFDKDNDGDIEGDEMQEEEQQAVDDNLNFESAFYGAIISKIAYYDDYMFMLMLQWIFSKPKFIDYLKKLNENSFNNKFVDKQPYITMAQDLVFKTDGIHSSRSSIFLQNSNIDNSKILWKNSRADNYNSSKQKLISLSKSQNLPFIIIRTSLDMYVYIIYSPETNTIILTFRGTNSIVSEKADINYTKRYMEDKNYFFHTGIYNQLEGLVCRIIYSMQKLIKDNSENTTVKVLVCGHSLGGALATMFSYYYCKEFTRSLQNDKLLEKKIYVISWGAPKIGGVDFTKNEIGPYIAEKKILILRCKNLNDIITLLPPENKIRTDLPSYTHVVNAQVFSSTATAINSDGRMTIDYKKSLKPPKWTGPLLPKDFRLIHGNGMWIPLKDPIDTLEKQNAATEDGKTSKFFGCKKGKRDNEKNCPLFYVKYYKFDDSNKKYTGGDGIGPSEYLNDNNWDDKTKVITPTEINQMLGLKSGGRKKRKKKKRKTKRKKRKKKKRKTKRRKSRKKNIK